VELGAELGLEFTLAEVLDLDYSGELDESELDAVAGGHKSGGPRWSHL
jgi:hypothetical protein